MRVYPDMCCLKRPYDDQTQPRIALETEAVLAVLQAIAAGHLQALRSPAHEIENEQNPDAERAAAVAGWLDRLNPLAKTPAAVAARVAELHAAGLKSFDAYHVAWAEHLAADVLLTTDDPLLAFCGRQASIIKVRVVLRTRDELMVSIPDPVQLRRRAVEVLIRELGYVDAMRFLRQCGHGAGDYSRERHTFLPDWSPDELVRRADDLVEQRRKHAP